MTGLGCDINMLIWILAAYNSNANILECIANILRIYSYAQLPRKSPHNTKWLYYLIFSRMTETKVHLELSTPTALFLIEATSLI